MMQQICASCQRRVLATLRTYCSQCQKPGDGDSWTDKNGKDLSEEQRCQQYKSVGEERVPRQKKLAKHAKDEEGKYKPEEDNSPTIAQPMYQLNDSDSTGTIQKMARNSM